MGTLLVCCFNSSAISPEEEERLESEIAVELKATAEYLIDADMFRRDFLGYDEPIEAPAVDLESVERQIREEVIAAAMEEYPPSLTNEFIAEAKEKYAQYRMGDAITVHMKNGDTFSGRLRDRDKYSVLVDLQRLRFEDMAPETLVRFDPVRADATATTYVREKLAELEEKRQSFIRRNENTLLRDALTRSGYLLNLGRWMPVKEWYEQELAAKRAEVESRLRPLLRAQKYFNAGYRLHNDVWLTREEISRRTEMEKQANQFPPEFEAELNSMNAENAASKPATTTGSGGRLGNQDLF